MSMSTAFHLSAVAVLMFVVGPAQQSRAESCPSVDAPQPINTNAGGGLIINNSPHVVTDGKGNWVAVWWTNDDFDGAIGTDFDIVFSRSDDNGLSWTETQPLNTNAGFDSGADTSPRLALDDQGNWIAFWCTFEDLNGEIGTDSDIVMSKSFDLGATWTPPVPLNSNAHSDSGPDWFPRAANDGQGNWVVIWLSKEDLGGIGVDTDLLVSRSSDDGLSWTDPVPLNNNASSDSGDEDNPEVITDGLGNWLVVWTSFDDLDGTIGSDRDILFARSINDGATWSDPAPLNSYAPFDIGRDTLAKPSTDGQGNWLVIWASRSDLEGTLGLDDDILFARSVDGGASWSDALPLNTNAAIDSGADFRPNITTDGSGIWLAAWDSTEDLSGDIGTDLDILYSLSLDDGANWLDPMPLNSDAPFDSGSDQGVPWIATDKVGRWIVVWRKSGILFTSLLLLDCNDNDVVDECDSDGRVTICHVPAGNPDNARTILVSMRALPAHLAHGDSCGPCEEDDGLLLMARESEVCSADGNGDGVVNAADLALLLGTWGQTPDPPGFDGDGDVDAFDLALVLGNWGPCP